LRQGERGGKERETRRRGGREEGGEGGILIRGGKKGVRKPLHVQSRGKLKDGKTSFP